MIASDDHDLRLALNGAPAFELTADGLVGLRLDRRLDAPATLTLRLMPGAENSDAALPRFGDRIELRRAGTLLFCGDVDTRRTRRDATGLTLEIAASDGLAKLARTRTPATHDIVSVHAHLRRLSDQASLGFSASGGDFAVGRHMTHATSDLADLTGLLGRYGLAVICKGTALVLLDRSIQDGTPTQLDAALTACEERDTPQAAAAEAFLGWRADADGATRPRGAGASGRGPRNVPLRAGEDTARLQAGAQIRACAACLSFSAELTGLHDLYPGDRVASSALHHIHSLTEASLLLDAAGGARTCIAASPPEATRTDRPPMVMAGQVSDIDDPQKAGRLRVTLPALGGLRTGWLTTCGPFGQTDDGTGLGLSFRPGDAVLLLAPEGDPELALVLGGLSRPGALRDGLTSGETRRSVILQANGSRLALHEKDSALELSLDDGTALRISPGRIALSASGSLDLSCDGRVRIRGARVDFEEA
jgi:hypothetical protein